MDGKGSARACNHCVRGNQYYIIVLSLETKKPLLVISRKMSCIKCSMCLTEMMNHQNAKINELKCTSMPHEVSCYRDTNMSPTSAEE